MESIALKAGDPNLKHVLIVANPYSGQRSNHDIVQALIEALSRLGLPSQVAWDPDTLAHMRADPFFKSRFRAVVAAGGDGTLRGAIEHRLELPVAVLPLGNENLFARYFGFVADPQWLAHVIARGRLRQVDLGEVNHQLFSCVVSAGFDAAVAHRVTAWRGAQQQLKRVGRHSYLKPMLDTFYHYTFPRVRLTTENQQVEGTLAMVFNLPEYAFGLPMCPQARGDDGMLDWVMFRHASGAGLLRDAMAVASGVLWPGVQITRGRARQITMASDRDVPIQIDGEATGAAPLTIHVLPQALSIFETG